MSTGSSFVLLLHDFSQMGFSMHGTSGGSTFNVNASYVIVSQSSSGGVNHYKVNIIEQTSSSSSNASINIQASVDSTGTVQWVYFAGMNYTGAQASAYFEGFGVFFTIYTSLQPTFAQITTAPGVHVTATGMATFGPTTLSVTTYSPSTLPFDATYCGGSVHLTRFSLQIGTASGSSFQIMTLLSAAGSTTSSSGTQSYDLTFQLTTIQRNTG